jgi:hypothetical protein
MWFIIGGVAAMGPVTERLAGLFAEESKENDNKVARVILA